MNNINEKISKMVENEQMPCINARDLKSKADEYNKNYESYWKELYNVIKVINEKITAEAEQGKYYYKGHIADVNKLGNKFEQFIDDLIKYYVDRSFNVFFAKQPDCSYKYTIRWGEIPDDDSKKYYDLNKTCEELQKVFNDNKNITFRKEEVNIERYGFAEGIVIEFYSKIWMNVTSWDSKFGHPYTFVNPYGYLGNHVESFKELVDIISNRFKTITDDRNTKRYYNLEKTYKELQKSFTNVHIVFKQDKVKTKRYGILEGIVISFYGEVWMNVTCWDDEHEYVFINPDGEFTARLEYYTELIDSIITQFNIITKEQNLDVDQYEYNNIDKTFNHLENFFKDKNVSFSRSTDENKFEYITAAFPYYHHRLRIDCCDETKHYCVEDNRDDVRIGDFNTLIKLINIIEAYIID